MKKEKNVFLIVLFKSNKNSAIFLRKTQAQRKYKKNWKKEGKIVRPGRDGRRKK